ncbi:hypothetical protein [Streptosporangium saharense]|uniref:hypothetical protein n=1 Tax=Streptosporangium saharense TaxID=1706840 RepID=UPI00332ACA1C
MDEDALQDGTVRALGSVQLALLSGVMVQWLADPEQAPTGAEILEGLRSLVDLFEAAERTGAPQEAEG